MNPNLPVGLPVDDMVKNLKDSYKDNLKVIKDENMARLMILGIRKRILDKLMIEVMNAVAGGAKKEGQVRNIAEAETIKWWQEVHQKAGIKSLPPDFANFIINQLHPEDKNGRDDKKNG